MLFLYNTKEWGRKNKSGQLLQNFFFGSWLISDIVKWVLRTPKVGLRVRSVIWKSSYGVSKVRNRLFVFPGSHAYAWNRNSDFFSGNTTVGSKLDGQPYRSSLRCSMTEIWLMNHHIPLFGRFQHFQSNFLPVSTFKDTKWNIVVTQHIWAESTDFRPISGELPFLA